MFGEILQKFAEKSPVTVMVRGLLEHLLNADQLDHWFESTRQKQYTRDILFSSLVGLMLQVVLKTRASVNAAYRYADISASIVAVYGKLQGMELSTSQALVRHIAMKAQTIIEQMAGGHPPLLPGFRVKYLDGNCLEASEHRLEVLRDTSAGPLPGKSLVVFDPQWGIAIDVFPCEDGHAQERALLNEVADTIQPNDVWVADRNFCVLQFLFQIYHQQAFFVIRQHANLPYKPLSDLTFIGESETGDVYEQAIEITSAEGEVLRLRRVEVHLKSATRDGAMILSIITNLAADIADALVVAEIYRSRWGIETAFQKLEKHLHSEINTLGYPKAALFGFCLALVAFNLYAVVMGALRATYPNDDIDQNLSEYYLAEEIKTTMTGMVMAVPDTEWNIFANASSIEVSEQLLDLARRVHLPTYSKTKRGPKKPRTPRTKFKGKPHVSTARLLAGT
jgi:hypothetical protein